MRLDFTARETWLHRANPALKLALSVCLFLYVLFVHNLNVLIVWTALVLLGLFAASGHPWKRLLLYSSPFFVIFLSTGSSMILFGEGTTTWFRWGLVHITEESFYRGVHLGVRALGFATIGLLFALTTRPVMLFYSLMQQVKLPPKYAYSFMAAMRLIPMVLEEFQTLRHALLVRGVQRQGSWKRPYRLWKAYTIPLLAQSIRRAQRIAVAMEAKRFDNDKARTYYYEVGFSASDALLIAAAAAACVCAQLLGGAFPLLDAVDVRHYG